MTKTCPRCQNSFDTDTDASLCDACVAARASLNTDANVESPAESPPVQIQMSERGKRKFELMNHIADRLTDVAHANQKQLPGKMRARITLALNQTSEHFNELVKIIKDEESERTISAYRLLAQHLIAAGITDRAPTLDELWTALEISPEALVEVLQAEQTKA